MPLAVVSSSSTALTISRSPRGLSFIWTSTSGLLQVRFVGTLGWRVPGVHSRTFEVAVNGELALRWHECQCGAGWRVSRPWGGDPSTAVDLLNRFPHSPAR